MRKPFSLPLLLLTLSGVHPAFAGSIITTNLPANVEIVNILGTADGASGNNPTAGEFASPYPSDPTLTLPAGTYRFFIVDPTDAAAAFPSLTATQLATIQTAWTFNNPWTTDYVVFDGAAVTNPGLTQLFDGANGTYNEGTTYGSQQAAYDAARSQGYYDNIRVGDRTSLNFQKTYTLTTSETLVFAVPDYLLSDNAGGVSVVVEAVPEPGTLAMFVVGGVLGWAAWNRRQQPRARFVKRCLGAAAMTGVGWLPTVCRAQETTFAPSLPVSTDPWPPAGEPLLAAVLVVAGALLLMERLCAWRLWVGQRRSSTAMQLRDVLPSAPLRPSRTPSRMSESSH